MAQGGGAADVSIETGHETVRRLVAEHPDWTSLQISEASGLSYSYVRAVGSRYGLCFAPKPGRIQAQQAKIIKLYKSGRTLKEIAGMVGGGWAAVASMIPCCRECGARLPRWKIKT
jgi:hypothetical protein